MTRVAKTVRERVLARGKYRCGYCLAPQETLYAELQIDHVIPASAGGSDDESNLAACCGPCNGHKYNKTSGIDSETEQAAPLFNPVTQNWREHFTFADDNATILGLTPTGRATVQALKLNASDRLTTRQLWAAIGEFPPKFDETT